MEVTICFNDDEMRSFLQAKACMEEELDQDICNDECIGRLAEMYLDIEKGKRTVFDTDEVD
jgi:hypothetical protein